MSTLQLVDLDFNLQGRSIRHGTVAIAPAALSARITEDYNPIGFADADVVRITPGAYMDELGGMAAGYNRQLKILYNDSATLPLALLDRGVGSTAANRFNFSGETAGGYPYVLRPNSAIALLYDPIAGLWYPEQSSPAVAMPDGSRGQSYKILPNTTTSVNTIGMLAATLVGTVSTPAQASTNLLTSTRRSVFTTAATAGSLASMRVALGHLWSGNAVRLGGFYFRQRFGLSVLPANSRSYFGLTSNTAAWTNIQPVTSTAEAKIGLSGSTDNSANWRLINNTNGVAPTIFDLGASFPVNTTDLLQQEIWTLPNAQARCGWRVTNLSTGAIAGGILTSNLPANTSFLTVNNFCCNNATAAPMAFDQAEVFAEMSPHW